RLPLFSMITAIILLSDERMSTSRAIGLLIGLVGVVAIARPFDAGIGTASMEGVLFMVIGSLSLGVSFVYARRFVTPLKLPAAALTTYQLGFASLILLIVTPMGDMGDIFSDTVASAGLIAGLGLFGTGIAYILYYFVIQKLGAVAASSVTYVPPVVALLIGALLVGEPIEALDYIATGCILAGVFLLNKRQRRAE
ncbi:MAG: DMT family transporter, partial [Pseudomonadota bacterium]